MLVKCSALLEAARDRLSLLFAQTICIGSFKSFLLPGWSERFPLVSALKGVNPEWDSSTYYHALTGSVDFFLTFTCSCAPALTRLDAFCSH
jgi:hypothetical protein